MGRFRSHLTNRENNVNSNPVNYSVWCSARPIFGPVLFFIFINGIRKCSNQFKYILYADDSTLSTCIPGDNIVHFAEQN